MKEFLKLCHFNLVLPIFAITDLKDKAKEASL